jgi:L-asparagine transporter-like permease
MISIGGIIGAGLFVGSSVAISAAGPAAVLSYLLAGTLVLLVMRMLGEMAVALPSTSSFTEFARVGLGPWAGFVCGWLYWYFWIIVVPVEAIAGANILHQWLPLPTWQLGLGLMAVMTVVNLMSARSYAEFEFWFASIKVSAIIVFIALTAAFVFGLRSAHGQSLGNLVHYGGFMPSGPISVLATAVTVLFSLTGAEIATVAAAESQEPARAVARLTTSVIVRILVFYVLSISLIVAAVPWIEVRSGESPFTLALSRMDFGWASIAMSAVILTAVLSCLNSAFYVCSRVMFLLAAHGDAPQWLVKVNSRHVPIRSVMIGAIAGVIGILAATLSPHRVFAFLQNASGALIVFIYIMIALAQIQLRRERQRRGEPQPVLQMWLFPWASYAAVGGFIAVVVAMAVTPGQQQDLYFSLVTVLVVMLAYALLRRRRVGQAATVLPS